MEDMSISTFLILAVLSFFLIKLAFGGMSFLMAKKDWENYPSLDLYMNRYNPTPGRGLSCFKCTSNHFGIKHCGPKHFGLKIHYCKRCNTALYRTGGSLTRQS